MDVNNTRFHLLSGRNDWSPLLPDLPVSSDDGPVCGLVWEAEQNSVGLRPLLYRFRKAETLHFALRRGAAMDGFEHWYVIGPDERHVTVLSRGTSQARHYWPPRPEDEPCEPAEETPGDFVALDVTAAPEPHLLRGLAVTTHQYLVVGSVRPPGLLIFDLHGGGPPMWLPWAMAGPQSAFSPLDIARRPDGGVWILDFDPSHPSPAPPRYWALDRYFRLEAPASVDAAYGHPPDFRPQSGMDSGGDLPGGGTRPGEVVQPGGVVRDPVLIDPEMAFELDLSHPVAVEGLPDDTVLFLEVDPTEGATRVARYAEGRRIGGEVALRTLLQAQVALGIDEKSGDLASWQGYDFAFVAAEPQQPRQVHGVLYVVGRDGNQAFAFLLQAEDDHLSLDLKDEYLPLRRFGGKALVAEGQKVYYDLDDRWVRLVAQPRPRYCLTGSLETRLFDGKKPDCVWHRLFLDACIPSGTSVRVESRASNDPNLIAHLPWEEEPRPYRRGSGPEMPFVRAYTDDALRRDGTGTWELAFQEARGRYLQLRLTLAGTGRSTPRISAIRIHYPRFSYVREYLPDVYQEDVQSASFLERFLANVEGTFTELEGRIAEVQRIFDERIVDEPYLDWLASWFGVLLDPAFTEAKRRLFIRHAIELFNQRGTLPGLVRTLRLALDPCADESIFRNGVDGCDATPSCRSQRAVGRFRVRIVEQFLTRSMPGVAFGDPTDLPKPGWTSVSESWHPGQGAAPLHARYRDFLKKRYADSIDALKVAWDLEAGDALTFDAIKLAPVPPGAPGRRADWRAFVRTSLGFPYAEVRAEDAGLYRGFLRRRYRQVKRLNDAYGKAYGNFGDVVLPAESDFPHQNPRLRDWIQFVSLALPIERNAHRFTVLVPVEPGMGLSEQQQRMELVRRIVAREKPAHTEFDVKPYWALFLVGTARLGLDSLLGESSRFLAMLLGQGHLSGSYLGRAHPGDVADRIVTGRDQPGVML